MKWWRQTDGTSSGRQFDWYGRIELKGLYLCRTTLISSSKTNEGVGWGNRVGSKYLAGFEYENLKSQEEGASQIRWGSSVTYESKLVLLDLKFSKVGRNVLRDF